VFSLDRSEKDPGIKEILKAEETRKEHTKGVKLKGNGRKTAGENEQGTINRK
jgi:hypothetical protein